jgi:hypothetical protein
LSPLRLVSPKSRPAGVPLSPHALQSPKTRQLHPIEMPFDALDHLDEHVRKARDEENRRKKNAEFASLSAAGGFGYSFLHVFSIILSLKIN